MNVGNRMGAVRGAVRTLWGHTTVCAPWGTSWTMTTTPVWMLTNAGPTSSTVLMNVSTWRAVLGAPASMVTTCRMMGNPVKVREEQPVTILSLTQRHHYITIHMMLFGFIQMTDFCGYFDRRGWVYRVRRTAVWRSLHQYRGILSVSLYWPWL